MKELAGRDRKYLRGLAHHLKPLVIIGQKGMTAQVVEEADRALEDHELIKVRFSDFKEEKKRLSAEIAQKTLSSLVGIVGNNAVFYREQPEAEKRKIKLP